MATMATTLQNLPTAMTTATQMPATTTTLQNLPKWHNIQHLSYHLSRTLRAHETVVEHNIQQWSDNYIAEHGNIVGEKYADALANHLYRVFTSAGNMPLIRYIIHYWRTGYAEYVVPMSNTIIVYRNDKKKYPKCEFKYMRGKQRGTICNIEIRHVDSGMKYCAKHCKKRTRH